MAVSIIAQAPIEFTKIERTKEPKITLTVDGLPKTRKTWLALSAPGPICIHNFDFGVAGILHNIPEEKEIYEFKYRFPKTAATPGNEWASISEAAKTVWTDFVLKYRASLDQMRTVVIDTGTKAWELCRLARLGKLTQVLPVQYTAVNQEFQEVLTLGQTSKANVIWIHRLKPEYQDDKRTGNFERAGFSDMPFEVDCAIRMTADDSINTADRFTAKIGTCRQRLLQGVELKGDNISFKNIAKLIRPDVDEKYWD